MSLTNTKCVILAAGMSTRLRPLTDNLPKCLLSVGGKTILERMVGSLLLAGIRNIGVVVGFQAEKVRSHLSQKFPRSKIRSILNPNFATTNNAYSLLLARSFFEGPKNRQNGKNGLLLLDSDILFHPSLITMMVGATGENKIAIRTQGNHDEEEVQLEVDGTGNVVTIGKNLALAVSVGESVGIELFGHEHATELFDVLERRVKRGIGRTEYYEAAFQEMIDAGTLISAVDVVDLPVMEIDSVSDLERAERIIIPKIDAMSHV